MLPVEQGERMREEVQKGKKEGREEGSSTIVRGRDVVHMSKQFVAHTGFPGGLDRGKNLL